MWFSGVLVRRNRGIIFELHDVVMMMVTIVVRMRFLRIVFNEKKVNGFERFEK